MSDIEHGEDRGYQAHRRAGERACIACMDAHRDYQRRVRKPPPPRELTPCPSEAAYFRHRRMDEEPCAGCRDAHAEAERERYAARQGAA